MISQKILTVNDGYAELGEHLRETKAKIMIVCDKAVSMLGIFPFLQGLDNTVFFSDFAPNPLYEDVKKGISVFKKENCGCIFAVGGGSAIDVAKCIKLFANSDPDENFLNQESAICPVPLIAMPTTAGSGSEATKYAVIYYQDQKQSVTDDECIPDIAVFDPSVLETLPEYQKKSTMLDALCHGIESMWSVNSTDESMAYSAKAITTITENMQSYLNGGKSVNIKMLNAAHTAGKAINITQTTAGHAMCYKLTGLYGIAHGHAAALCLAELLEYTAKNTDRCIDNRGKGHLQNALQQIADALGCENIDRAAAKFREIIKSLQLTVPVINDNSEYDILTSSVNPVRLKNNPIRLDRQVVLELYHNILSDKERQN